MKERPIIFNGETVRAILDGRKTQTLRIVKPQPFDVSPARAGAIQVLWDGRDGTDLFARGTITKLCPFGAPGDRLWVRETWARDSDLDPAISDRVVYAADRAARYFNFRDGLPTSDMFWLGTDYEPPQQWKPSIHMPRWASRITLEITGIRVEQLRDISEEDAIAEGIELISGGYNLDDFTGCWKNYSSSPESYWNSPIDSFHSLWESIHGAESWKENPWAWVLEFRRIKK